MKTFEEIKLEAKQMIDVNSIFPEVSIDEAIEYLCTNTRISFLRSEIEKLEGMKVQEFHACATDVIDGKEVSSCPAFCTGVQHNTALTSIITRYKEELLELEKGV